MEAYNCYAAAIARSVETQFGHAIVEHKKMEGELLQLRRRRRGTEQMLEKTTQEAEETSQKWKIEQEANDILKAEKASLEDQLEKEKTSAEETTKKYQLEVERLQKKLEELRLASAEEKEAAMQEAFEENERGFNRALAQVQVLYPELDLSGTEFYKDIVDEQVVEVDD